MNDECDQNPSKWNYGDKWKTSDPRSYLERGGEKCLDLILRELEVGGLRGSSQLLLGAGEGQGRQESRYCFGDWK